METFCLSKRLRIQEHLTLAQLTSWTFIIQEEKDATFQIHHKQALVTLESAYLFT